MKTKKLYCNFASNIYYCECKNYKEFTNHLKRKFPEMKDEFWGDNFDGETQTITYKGERHYYIWAEERDLIVINHEVLHVCLRVAEHLGIPTDVATSEFLTYLQEDLVKQITMK